MEKMLRSEGRCLYCKQMIVKKEMSRHLAKHLVEREKNEANSTTVNCCHVEVEDEVGEMFLQLLVRGDATMKSVDQFLKDIWLDCCGHLSAFGHKNFKVSKSHRVEDVMESRIKIRHDYDFGSTTRVFLKGVKHYHLKQKEKIALLSRNEPLKEMCKLCKKMAATDICIECMDDDYNYLFLCEKCSEIHEETCDAFRDYGRMPVVNSPRMGVCGYEGGVIDLERDRAIREVGSCREYSLLLNFTSTQKSLSYDQCPLSEIQ